jgi:hypothetical protein
MTVEVNTVQLGSGAVHGLRVLAAHSGAAEDPFFEVTVLPDCIQRRFADAAEEFAGACVAELRVVKLGADVGEARLGVCEGVSESGVPGIVGEVFDGHRGRAPAG